MKERTIYARERFFNLRIDSYYFSKLAVLGFLAATQATFLFGVAVIWRQPPGSSLGQWAVLAMLAIAGTTLGLLISALARTEEMAIALVPLAVAPQIVFAGVITPLSVVGTVFHCDYNDRRSCRSFRRFDDRGHDHAR